MATLSVLYASSNVEQHVFLPSHDTVEVGSNTKIITKMCK